MVPRQLLEQAESIQFATELNVVSSERLFESALRQHPVVRGIFGHLVDEESREQLAVRLADLLSRDVDPRYQHPHDVALAVYLRLLDVCDPQLGALAATTAIRQPNLWWARSVAMEILEGSRTRTREVNTVTTDQPAPAQPSTTRTIADAGTQTTWIASPLIVNGAIFRTVRKRNASAASTRLSSRTRSAAA
jgi:hypothetical protein